MTLAESSGNPANYESSSGNEIVQLNARRRILQELSFNSCFVRFPCLREATSRGSKDAASYAGRLKFNLCARMRAEYEM